MFFSPASSGLLALTLLVACAPQEGSSPAANTASQPTAQSLRFQAVAEIPAGFVPLDLSSVGEGTTFGGLVFYLSPAPSRFNCFSPDTGGRRPPIIAGQVFGVGSSCSGVGYLGLPVARMTAGYENRNLRQVIVSFGGRNYIADWNFQPI